MRLSLVYQLGTDDPGFLDSFYPLARIRSCCRERGIELSFSLARDVEADLPGFLRASEGSRVWLRGDLPEGLLGRLSGSGADCFNAAASILGVKDKRGCYALIREEGAPFPALLDPDDRESLAASLPIIVKPRRGMMGRGVRLIEDRAGIDAALAPPGAADGLIFQEYVEASRGSDYRVFACRGAVLAVARRRSAGLLSNAHQGASTFPAELPARWTGLALRLLSRAGLEYGAVDFLERGPDDLLVCEINACPGFEALERACGVDVAGAILDACLG